MLYSFNFVVVSYHLCLSVPICTAVPLSIVDGTCPDNGGFIQGFVGATNAYVVEEKMLPR